MVDISNKESFEYKIIHDQCKHKLDWLMANYYNGVNKKKGEKYKDPEQYNLRLQEDIRKAPNILNDEDEVIHRKDWDIEGICGVSKEHLHHKHFDYMSQYSLDNYKSKSKTLVLFKCTTSRPYSHYIKKYMEICKDKADICVLSAPGIIPIEYDNHYPYRYYDWDTSLETPEILEEYKNVLYNKLKTFLYKFKYEKIICCIRPSKFFGVCKKLESEGYPIQFIYNDKLVQSYKDRGMWDGLIQMRFMNLIGTKEALKGLIS